MPSLAIHDVTGSTPGLPGRACFQLPGVFGISRNQRSASSEIGVRLGPKSLFSSLRNGCSFSPVLHTSRSFTYSVLVRGARLREASRISWYCFNASCNDIWFCGSSIRS